MSVFEGKILQELSTLNHLLHEIASELKGQRMIREIYDDKILDPEIAKECVIEAYKEIEGKLKQRNLKNNGKS
jgi:hypothetical protein